MPRSGNSSPTAALKAWALHIFATLADAACMIFGSVHCTVVVAADPGKPVGRGCKEECMCTVYRVTAQTFAAAHNSLGLQAHPCTISELNSCVDAVFDAVRQTTAIAAEKSRKRQLVVATPNFDCLDFVVKAMVGIDGEALSKMCEPVGFGSGSALDAAGMAKPWARVTLFLVCVGLLGFSAG
jgi:hypothetical protein